MERRTSTLALLCVVWSAVAGIKVDIPQDQYEFARGDNITLPCTFQSALSNPILAVVSWSIGENVIITHYHPNGVTDIKPEYEGRVSVDANVNGGTGKADLKLSSITTADNKKYECQVQNPKDNVGKDADTTTLTVLVAPSKPICKIEGTASYGQNVSLTCVSEEGSPPPTYKWNRYDVQNNSGAFPPKTTEKEGTLFLYNLTKETSGFYICTSANKIRSASCNLTVTVLPPSMMSIGSIAAIIGAGVAALILLIVIYCCCCRKKDDDKENYAMAPVGDEESVRNGESRSGDGEKSKHFDDSSANKTANPRDDYEERSERNYDRRSDYDDRRSDYDDRRSDYDDRRSDYNDRRSDYDDRRSDYNDRRSDYDDRRSDYNDRRSDYNDRRSKPSDRNERYDDDRHYDDERRYNDRRDPRYDDDRNRP
ncbi:cell surface A33 antigen-like isoform X1 [Poecilia latipinna]|uniref:cell surface A33 antigen-like isoform X1 n=1 Tax=Poecilia latipinna TaxID=48699 RepID=UPI00072E3576|nr:PREDICTED: cell surface A33 antigen-like isoform X1 [Poecilia latipinna]